MGVIPHCAAVILAAGRGLRFGSDIPKQYCYVGGEPLLKRTVRVFLTHDRIDRVVVVAPAADLERASAALGDLADRVMWVEGGMTRQQSALSGLRALKNFQPDYVHIHDGVRPFVSHALLDAITVNLLPQQGVVPALPVIETLKKGDGTGEIIATCHRQELYQAQTPQSFPFSLILAAHEQAEANREDHFTDDSSIAERYGIRMRLIEGEADNIKITRPDDSRQANRILMENKSMFFPDMRTGNGYDVHALEAGDGVTLCGVKIAHNFKLSGHSDADVALHALTDALLATLGAGDIGTHFPPSDPQWCNARSCIFVAHALALVRERRGRIVNIDITLIAEAPKIGPYRGEMVASLAAMLGLEAGRISIKATTSERLGFIGRQEGIAALATANVLYPGHVPDLVTY